MKTKTKTNTQAPEHTHTKKDEVPASKSAYYVALRERYAETLRAIPAQALRTPTLDVPTAVTVLHGVGPALTAMRPQVATLTQIDLAEYDALHDYTELLQYTNGRVLTAIAAPDPLPALNQEADTLREGFLAHTQPLVFEGKLQAKQLDELRSAQGYKPVATALIAVADAVRVLWPTLEGRTLLEFVKVDRALEVGDLMLIAVGARERRDEEVFAASDERLRAFTLAANAYDQARRAVHFLRWNEGDADEITPSLWAKNTGPRRAKSEVEETKNEKPVVEPKEPTPAKDSRPLPPNEDPPFAFPVTK